MRRPWRLESGGTVYIPGVQYIPRFASAVSGPHQLASTNWGASKALSIRSGVNTVPLAATVENMVPGSYTAADFVFWNR